MPKKKILLNAFNMNAVGHINHGLWTHPRDRSAHYTDLDYWTSLAQTLERGKFDGIFLADIVGVYDVYEGGPDTPLREAVQIPINDPALIVPAMASRRICSRAACPHSITSPRAASVGTS